MKLNYLLQATCFLLLLMGYQNKGFAQAQPRCTLDARVSLASGETTIVNCLTDDEKLVYRLRSRPLTSAFAYLVTNSRNIIVGISTDNFLDLESYGPGDFRVYSFSYIGDILARVGQNATTATLASSCYGLSTNYIEVFNVVPDGGIVAADGGQNRVFSCPGDGKPDLVRFSTTSNNPFYSYIITDENNVIIGLPQEDSQDFEEAAPGICRVWGFSHIETITPAIGQSIMDLQQKYACSSLSLNFIEVVRQMPNGGNIEITNGATIANLCLSPGASESISFSSDQSASKLPYRYIVANEAGQILEVLNSSSKVFSADATGNFLIRGVQYTGKFNPSIGQSLSNAVFSDDCFDLSDNTIQVFVRTVEAGSVSLTNDEPSLIVCGQDGNEDLVSFKNTNASGDAYGYIITDQNDVVLEVVAGNSKDFDGSSLGTCKVWGVSFSGDLLAPVGESILDAVFSASCFDISENFITITKTEVEGGTISLPDGSASTNICPGDGRSDIVVFQSNGATGSAFTYLITDTQNNILSINASGTADFDNADLGTCRVWGLSYTGNLLAAIGQNAAEAMLSDECYALSTNFIEIIKEEPRGGTVSLADGNTSALFCTNDGLADLVNLEKAGASNTPYVFVLTDANNIVVEVLEGNEKDFEGFGAGISRMWGVAYTGNLAIVKGDNIRISFLSDDCFDVSENFITINREIPFGGSFTFGDGTVSKVVCPEGAPNMDNLQLSGQSGSQYAFLVINDANGTIVSIANEANVDLSNLPEGQYTIYGFAYNGSLNFGVGSLFADVSGNLTSGCFDISTSTVSVISTIPDAGLIAVNTPDPADTLAVCSGDGLDDIISFQSTASGPASSALVVINEAGEILSITAGDSIDLGSIPSGTARVRWLTYTGTLTAQTGDTLGVADLSTDCADLSENFITIINTNVDGGKITSDLIQSNDNIFLCSDGQPDVVKFSNSSTNDGTSYAYIVTTINDIMLIQIDGDSLDFEGTGFDRLKVWGVSYSGNLVFTPGRNINSSVLSDGCYALSENFITVFSDQPDGGSISIQGGETELRLCVGAVSPIVEFSKTSRSDAGFAYILLDTNHLVIDIFEGNEIDFTEIPVGNYSVLGLSFTGLLNEIAGENPDSIELATGCFELSENEVTIFRAPTIDGGTLSLLLDDETVTYTCPGDGMSDLVVVLTSSQDASYRFVITDANNIVRIPNPGTNVINFEGAAMGEWKIWGLAYSGNPLISFGDNILTDILSDECWVLSSNFITVINEQPKGGTVMTIDSTTEVVLNILEGTANTVFFTNEAASKSRYQYLVTTQNDELLAVAEGSSFDFSSLAAGVYKVVGLSYTGNLTIQPGQIITEVALSDDCFSLSENFISVTLQSQTPAIFVPETPQITGSEITANAGLQIFPNPVQTTLNVSITSDLPAGSEARIDLVNISGQLIKSIPVELVKGKNEINIDVNQLQNGIYQLILNNGKEISGKRFVKN